MAAKRATSPQKQNRHFAAGGLTADPTIVQNPGSYTPTAGEQKMLGDFDNRMAEFGIKGSPAGTVSISKVSSGVEEELPGASDPWSPYSYESIRRPSVAPQLGFAEGGKIDPEELMRQMSAKYGAPSEIPSKGILAEPLPATQPRPTPVAQPQATGQGILGVLRSRKESIDKASGYANGGIMGGLKIKGPGTPTSDSIDAVVRETKEPIKVSTDERVVSHAQNMMLEGIARGIGYSDLDTMLEAGTGRPVGPTVKAGKRAAADGLNPEDAMPAAKPLGILAQPINIGDNQPLRTKDILPGGYIDRGAGILASRDSTGQLNVTNVGTEKFTDSGKGILDGSASALIDQKSSTYNPAHQLANMQRLRLETDAFDPSITDPNVRDSARAHIAEQDKQAGRAGEIQGRLLENQIKTTKLAGEGQMAGLQARYLAEPDPARRSEIAQQIRALNGKGEGGPSLGQQSNNLEIDAARKTIAGLTQEDIKKRTANYTATGRENPDFDPTLAHQVKLANSRKVGADDHFDQRMQAQPTHGTDGDTVTRFRADQNMKGHALGKQTPKGVEVLDASGKVIGHYR